MVGYSGADAPFVDGVVTPFRSLSSEILKRALKEAVEERFPKESSKSLLSGPKSNNLGPEKGRLDRLYAAYVAAPTADNLNALLGEVERFARHVTLGKGGAFAKRLAFSVTEQYSATEISSETMLKVWRKLPEFKGDSKFSVWVFQIARNTLKDKCREIVNRHETEILNWKKYETGKPVIRRKDGTLIVGDGTRRAASGSSANGSFEIKGGSKTSLPRPLEKEDARLERLDLLVSALDARDKEIINLVRDGYTPAEIGKAFGKNSKWASNNIDRIKKTLKQSAASKTTNQKRHSSEGQALPASEAAD